MKKSKPTVHVRWMIRRDMPEVVAIEAAAGGAWAEEDFLWCLRQRNCIGVVAEVDYRVVGFVVYELHETRLHVLNFAVHPSARRAGVGAMMVGKLVNKLTAHCRAKITLAVREDNTPGLVYMRKRGFRAAAYLPGHFGPQAGAVWMEYAAAGLAGCAADCPNRLAQYQ